MTAAFFPASRTRRRDSARRSPGRPSSGTRRPRTTPELTTSRSAGRRPDEPIVRLQKNRQLLRVVPLDATIANNQDIHAAHRLPACAPTARRPDARTVDTYVPPAANPSNQPGPSRNSAVDCGRVSGTAPPDRPCLHDLGGTSPTGFDLVGRPNHLCGNDGWRDRRGLNHHPALLVRRTLVPTWRVAYTRDEADVVPKIGAVPHGLAHSCHVRDVVR